MAPFLILDIFLTSPNQFSKFFHCQNQEEICKDPNTPQVYALCTRCHTTEPCESPMSDGR